jgi:predicted Zn-dependent protease
MRLGLAAAPFVAGLLYARAPSLPLAVGAAFLSATLLLTFTLPGGRRIPQPVVASLATEPGD